MTANSTGPSAPGGPAGTARPSVDVWAGLLDDAALFPPGDAPMARAVPAHRRYRAGAFSPMVGAFLVPAARLAEPRDDRRPAVLDALAGTGMRAKLRTGGVRASAFPPAAELAADVVGCRDRGVGFKATAGLHRAVHHADAATGFIHHGYLNLLLAADVAATGRTAAEVAEVLAEPDTGTVVTAVRAIGPGSSRWDAARALFRSFGTCSITEPIADLETLGLLDVTEAETTP